MYKIYLKLSKTTGTLAGLCDIHTCIYIVCDLLLYERLVAARSQQKEYLHRIKRQIQIITFQNAFFILSGSVQNVFLSVQNGTKRVQNDSAFYFLNFESVITACSCNATFQTAFF